MSKKTEAIQTEFWERVENSLSKICWTWQRHHKPWSSLTSRTVKSENHWLNLIHHIQLFIPICTAVNWICCTEKWIWQSSTRTSTYNVKSNKKQRKLLHKKKKKTIEKIERVVFLDSNKLSKEKKAASFRLIHSERTVIQKHTRTFLLHMKHVKPPLARFYQGIPLNSV